VPRSIRALPPQSILLFSAAFWILISLVLRAVAIVHYKVNSDESQHLHIAWSWSRGLHQYRDVFDNHMPLFHLLFAPLVAMIGERADIVFWMRLAMLPLLAVTLGSVYAIGKSLFSSSVGLWAALLLSLSTGFLLSSTEFRTDNLWTALWALAMAVLVSGPITSRRIFGTGLLVGLCFVVSLKSVLLLAALVIAALSVVRHRGALARNFRRAGILLAGAAAPIIAVGAWFYASGAWDAFIYCTVRHNLLPRLGNERRPERALIAVLALPLLILAARRIFLSAEMVTRSERLRALIFVAGFSYLILLVSFWPLIPRQDYLPAYPLVAVFLAAAALSFPAVGALAATSVICVVSLVAFLRVGLIRVDQTAAETSLLRDVLRLSSPSDLVMDTKGETVFRTRPFYYALETITSQRIERGLIVDDIPERMIRTRTCIVSEDSGRYPARAREFLKTHYVSVGTLRVPGHIFEGRRAVFDVPFDAEYGVVNSSSSVSPGLLDGVPYSGVRFLRAGAHEFVSPLPSRIAFVWGRALEKGFSPFGLPRLVPKRLAIARGPDGVDPEAAVGVQ